VAIQDGISFRHGDAAVRAAYGYVVLGCHVHYVHCYPNRHLGVVLDNEEKKALGAAGKAWKNACTCPHPVGLNLNLDKQQRRRLRKPLRLSYYKSADFFCACEACQSFKRRYAPQK